MFTLRTIKFSTFAALVVTAATVGFASEADARPFGFAPLPFARPMPAFRPMAFRPAAPAPMRFAPSTNPITAANCWNAGCRQPYLQYPNSGISAANCWNAGCRQPYYQYSNSGISQANCWNAGCNQPYNQYKNVLQP
jgi:hypothetical protein